MAIKIDGLPLDQETKDNIANGISNWLHRHDNRHWVDGLLELFNRDGFNIGDFIDYSESAFRAMDSDKWVNTDKHLEEFLTAWEQIVFNIANKEQGD